MLACLVGLLAALPTQGAQTIELSRGATVPTEVGPYRYWAVSDATLVQESADANFGGDLTLKGGPGRTVLIRFDDLNRAVGPKRRVTDARLVFTKSLNFDPMLRLVTELRNPWGEGPIRRLLDPMQPGSAPRWTATWRHRRAGESPLAWESPGANGAQDGITVAPAGIVANDAESVTIGGLGATVQKWLDQPFDNHGLALFFQNPVEFESSEAYQARPKLVITTEPIAPKAGPDLAVVSIARTPGYPRYFPTPSVREYRGQPVAVPVEPASDLMRWPADGEEVTYTATFKNVGTETAQPFRASWVIGELPSTTFLVDQSLAPGETATVSIRQSFKNQHNDHRTQPVAVRILPNGPEANRANDALEIQACGLSVGVAVPRSVADSIARSVNARGSRSVEDWVQSQIDVFNNVFMAQSRFSFAPEGSLERVRVQWIRIIEDDEPTPVDANADAVVRVAAVESPFAVDRTFLATMATAMRLPNLSSMVVSAPGGGGGTVTDFIGALNRESTDRFPGLTGGGDTRYEGWIHSSFMLPVEPISEPMADLTPTEATNLLAATEVAAFNRNLGKRGGFAGDILYDLPTTVMIRARDYLGRSLPNLELTVFQSRNGKIDNVEPLATLITDQSGSAALASYSPNTEGEMPTLTGHNLHSNPFGRLALDGSNGVLLIRGIANGITEWAWVKSWQITDLYTRGSIAVAIVDVRLNLPSAPLDTATDIAAGRLIADSAGSASNVIGGLLDPTSSTDVTLPSGPGAWVEVDLGRDRTIGEIRLVPGNGEMWREFDVMVYGTGETPDQARLWTKEKDWPWTVRNRRDGAAPGYIAYRGAASRARFVRLVPRDADGQAVLRGIRVFPSTLGG